MTLSEVADAAKAALPLRGAGFIDLAAQRVLLQSPTPEPDIDSLGQAVVGVRWRHPILLRDVATVKMAPALRSGDSLIMAKPGVMLSTSSQYGANTLQVTLAVEKALADLRAGTERAGNHPLLRPAPAGEFHRARAAESEAVPGDRRGADTGGAVHFLARHARRLDRVHRDSPVSAGGGRGAPRSGIDAQHHDARRICRRPRRAGGRCDHRHRKHFAPACARMGSRRSRGRASISCWKPRSKSGVP